MDSKKRRAKSAHKRSGAAVAHPLSLLRAKRWLEDMGHVCGDLEEAARESLQDYLANDATAFRNAERSRQGKRTTAKKKKKKKGKNSLTVDKIPKMKLFNDPLAYRKCRKNFSDCDLEDIFDETMEVLVAIDCSNIAAKRKNRLESWGKDSTIIGAVRDLSTKMSTKEIPVTHGSFQVHIEAGRQLDARARGRLFEKARLQSFHRTKDGSIACPATVLKHKKRPVSAMNQTRPFSAATKMRRPLSAAVPKSLDDYEKVRRKFLDQSIDALEQHTKKVESCITKARAPKKHEMKAQLEEKQTERNWARNTLEKEAGSTESKQARDIEDRGEVTQGSCVATGEADDEQKKEKTGHGESDVHSASGKGLRAQEEQRKQKEETQCSEEGEEDDEEGFDSFFTKALSGPEQVYQRSNSRSVMQRQDTSFSTILDSILDESNEEPLWSMSQDCGTKSNPREEVVDIEESTEDFAGMVDSIAVENADTTTTDATGSRPLLKERTVVLTLPNEGTRCIELGSELDSLSCGEPSEEVSLSASYEDDHDVDEIMFNMACGFATNSRKQRPNIK